MPSLSVVVAPCKVVVSWIGGVLALAVAVSCFEVPAATASTTSTQGLGVYAGGGNAANAVGFGQDVGRAPSNAMDFLNGSSWSTMTTSLQTWLLQAWHTQDFSMTWGVDMLPDSGASLATGATGAYNGYFKTIASELVAGGQSNAIIRLGWEFNGGWFPWAASGQSQAFVTYWQQIVTTMRSVPGAAFRFEWNPTRGGSLPLEDYYPGDRYVDLIGMDVYDQQWNIYPGPQAEWQYMLSEPYGLNWLASFAGQHGKLITFPEWGIVNDGAPSSGGDNGYFVSQMASWIANNPVLEANYWQYGSSALFSGDTPNASAAMVASFGPGAVTSPAPSSPLATTSTASPSATLVIASSVATAAASSTIASQGVSRTGPKARKASSTASKARSARTLRAHGRAERQRADRLMRRRAARLRRAHHHHVRRSP
jgi:hypothetical protein